MTASLVVCIPTLTGYVSAWTLKSVFEMTPDPSFVQTMLKGLEAYEYSDEATAALDRVRNAYDFQIADTWLWPYDLELTRSRAVHTFLTQTQASHLLFIDADVAFDAAVIRRMLDTEKDFIGVTYPRRNVRLEMVAEACRNNPTLAAESAAYSYVVRGNASELDGEGVLRLLGDDSNPPGLGMGCTLLSRECLMKMTFRYMNELSDEWAGYPLLFAKDWALREGKRCRDSEDLSFCRRWYQLGGSIHMYIGEGAPASQFGGHLFKGTQEGFKWAVGAPGRNEG